MVTYIRSDLDFILNQIKIAEEHSRYLAGDPTARPLFGADGMIPANNISWGLRTVDGTYNNLIPGQEHYGSADQPFPNLLDPDYRHGFRVVDLDGTRPGFGSSEPDLRSDPELSPASIIVDSAPRTISNLIVDMSPANPAAVEKALDLAGIEGTAKAAALTAIADAVDVYKAAIAAGAHRKNRRGSRPCGPAGRRHRRKASRWPARAWSCRTSRPTRACRRRSTRGSRSSASSSTTASTSSPRGRAAPSLSRCSRTIRCTSEGSHTNFMVLTRATVDAEGRGHEPHHALRRPEPDLHLASLAPGLPARVRDDRQRAGRHRQGARWRQWRTAHLGPDQGAGRGDARHPPRGRPCREPAAARDRSLWQLHPWPRRFPAGRDVQRSEQSGGWHAPRIRHARRAAEPRE